jgi:hypothetical protein
MKGVVKKLFLHGRALKYWTAWKARRLENDYQQQIQSVFAVPGFPAAPRISMRGRSPLRRLLFISDCMWELEELVPELARIADVTVLNLRPFLQATEEAGDNSSAIVRAIEGFLIPNGKEPDAVLFYARGALLSEAVFHQIRRRWNAPLIGMNLDDKAQFFDYHIFHDGNDGYQHWARFFDVNLTSSRFAAEWYRKANLSVLHCPMGYRRRPEYESPPTSAAYKYQFSFVGSHRVERERLISAIQQSGLPLTVFGNGWPKSAWTENATGIYRESQLNLGINYWSAAGRGTSLKARDFECPGAGACYLTSFNWELAAFYEIGREILCWSSLEELVEMYLFYASRPEECLRIAQAGHRRSWQEHAWEHRFRRVFSEMGF